MKVYIIRDKDPGYKLPSFYGFTRTNPGELYDNYDVEVFEKDDNQDEDTDKFTIVYRMKRTGWCYDGPLEIIGTASAQLEDVISAALHSIDFCDDYGYEAWEISYLYPEELYRFLKIHD